ncbi:MAG: hypothetical protein RLY69_1133, partial [Verrucomicrobiota bacterium]
ETDGVGEDDVIAELAVVGDMRVAEQQIVGANARRRVIVGAAMHGAVFAELVEVADFEHGRFALVLEVLGFSADGGVGIKFVAAAKLRGAFEHDMRMQHAVVAKFDMVADDAVRPDADIRAKLGERRNNGGGMNHGAHFRRSEAR